MLYSLWLLSFIHKRVVSPKPTPKRGKEVISVTSQIDNRYPYSINEQGTFTVKCVYSLIYGELGSITTMLFTIVDHLKSQPKRREAATL